MRIYPALHSVDFGESLTWEPPPTTARFFVWTKSLAYTFLSPDDTSERTYGGEAPRWMQVAGWDVENDVELEVGHTTLPAIVPTAAGLSLDWASALALFDGHDGEVLMVSALNGNGRVICIDRFALPGPNSTDAATIAAQERRLLQTLLNSRERVAASPERSRTDGDGIGTEDQDLAVLDRRVAEVRARIAWFEQAAGGNVLPRLEMW